MRKELLFLILSCLATALPSFAQIEINLSARENILENISNLPLGFVENKGQVERSTPYGDIQFSTQTAGGHIFFAERGIFYNFLKAEEEERKGDYGEDKYSYEHMSYNVEFRGGRNDVKLSGREEQEGKINYFLGNDPSKHVTNISTYNEVLYKNIYDKIDLRYYGVMKKLKYDVVLHPGSRVEDIEMAYHGVKGVNVNSEGQLEVMTSWGVVKEEAPYSYQIINGMKREVEVQYKKRDEVARTASAETVITFEVIGMYDPSYELVIDPYTLLWSTFVGGTELSDDYLYSITTDDAGYIYATGFCNAAFPVTAGSYDTAHNGGGTDVFILKLNPTGTSLVYSTCIGGSSAESGFTIAIDSTKAVYVAGSTSSSNFPVVNAFQPKFGGGGNDAFVVKLNPKGNALEFSTYLGGSNTDGMSNGSGIAVSPMGEVYVIGFTTSDNFPTTSGAFQTAKSTGSGSDVFITKFNRSGKRLGYSTYLGGTDYARGIAVNSAGEAYVVGKTSSSSFPVTPSAFQKNLKGSWNSFVTKLNATGSDLMYSTYLGEKGINDATAIAINDAGEAFVTGRTGSASFPVTANAYDKVLDGPEDAFITKFNKDGSALVYSTYIGGSKPLVAASNFEIGTSIALTKNGEAFIAGFTASRDFPVTPDAYQPKFGGVYDHFVCGINAKGDKLVYSTYMGGKYDDYTWPSISIDKCNENITVGGTSHSSDFPTTAGTYQPVKLNGTNDQPVMYRFSTSSDEVCSISVCPSVEALNGKKPGELLSIPIILNPSTNQVSSAQSIDVTIRYPFDMLRPSGYPLSLYTLSNLQQTDGTISFRITPATALPPPKATIAELQFQVLLSPSIHGVVEVTTSLVTLRSGESIAGVGCPAEFTLDSSCIQPSTLKKRNTISSNYPNPFTSETTIQYFIGEEDFVRLVVTDVFGREVKTLANSYHTPGWYRASVSSKDLSSGVYFYRFETGTSVIIRPMVVGQQ